MLEQIAVVFPQQQWRDEKRHQLSAHVAAEFPSLFVRFESGEAERVHLKASQWDDPDFDGWRFDCAVDELAREPFTLRLEDDRGDRAEFPLEVLNRCQRAIDRRNAHSRGPSFERVLRKHRALHDFTKPLVRADYKHAVDTWQWLLRLEPAASLPLQLAALFHDIERLASEPDARIEHLAPDYQRFKDAHAQRGAEITSGILADSGVVADVRERVADIIAAHERQSPDPEVALLNDADALSFFSLNSSGYVDYFGKEQARRKVAYTWNRLREQARAKLSAVRLRPDVRDLLDGVRQSPA